MSEAAVRVAGLHKRYGDKRALDGVDLSIARGEITGFVGPNGAGKTTCLRVLVGLIRRDAGEVDVLGLDPGAESLAVRRRTCYLPGETAAYLHMRGDEFLTFALAFYPRRNAFERELLDAFALPLDRRVRTYSAGMKQKLALCATLIPDVELYLLDEPDRALDASARLLLRDFLRRLRDAGKSVLLSSHHLSEIDALANRTVFLLSGRRVANTRVEAARRALRHEVRLWLNGDHPLPSGTLEREVLPDGAVRVRTEGDPFAWLARVRADHVVSAEVGATRLEDLYRALTAEDR